MDTDEHNSFSDYQNEIKNWVGLLNYELFQATLFPMSGNVVPDQTRV